MAQIDNSNVERTYHRLARVYDVAFGEVLHSGRKRAVGELQLLPGQRVLEAGVGTGLTLPLYPSHCHVIGLDYSRTMLAQARRRVVEMDAGDRIELLQGDAAHLPFEDGAFDVVYAPYMISVVADPVEVGCELRRVCRPGGRVVLLNHFQSEHPVGAWLERLLSPLTMHLAFRMDLALMPLLSRVGLRPLSIQAVNVPPIWKLVICTQQ